ncbi:MAG: DUF4145 domain-containing protein [Solirubrobacteraceae bacterium]
MPFLGLIVANELDPEDPPSWRSAQRIMARSFDCGYCGHRVSSDQGWDLTRHNRAGQDLIAGAVAICPGCKYPSLLTQGVQVPSAPYGEDVEHLPDDIAALYAEVRAAAGAGAPTAAVMAARKILMAVAVDKGAPEDKNFLAYVDWLVDNGVVTSSMKDLVDEIRKIGNEANHEIELVTPEAADELVACVVMVVRIAYEFPGKGGVVKAARAARATGP